MDLISVGQRLKIMRILSGYTQDELSVQACLNRASYVCLENDKANLSAQKAINLANAVGCSPSYLMFGEPIIDPGAAWALRIPGPRHLYLVEESLAEILPSFFMENQYTQYDSFDGQNIIVLLRGTTPAAFIALETELLGLVLECVKSNLGWVCCGLDVDDVKNRINLESRKRDYARAKAAFGEIEVKYLEAKKCLDSFNDLANG